jgi:hypothetical protein
MAAKEASAATRSYRLFFRDAGALLAKAYDVHLSSDDDASQLAVLMLDDQTAYPCVEVWDGARLVCSVRRGE